MKLRPLAFAVTAAVAGLPSLARAQSGQPPPPSRAPRIFGGGELIYAQPRGDFGDYVSRGWGGAGHVLFAADRRGILALRLEGGLLNYGNERKRGCISDAFGCRILVDVTTSNNIVFGGIGPQLLAPTGRLRPYLNGLAGFSYLYTQSSLESANSGDGSAILSTTNFHDAVLAASAGGGIYIPLTLSRVRFSVDVGVSHRWSGKTRYLREGSITDLPDGSIEYTPIESRTDMLMYHVGVSFGAR